MLTQDLALCTGPVHHQLVRIDLIIEAFFVFNSMTLYISSVNVLISHDHLKLNRYLFYLHITIIIVTMIIRDYVPVSVLF